MYKYIQTVKGLLNNIENESDFDKQLEIIDELCDLSCDFYNDMLDRKHG
jgi:hypothetical protein